MSKFCKVYGCRYPHSHVTKGHRCGACKTYGHGIYECNSLKQKEYLEKHYDDELPYYLHCTFSGCTHSNLHTKDAHHCKTCGQNHSINDCPLTEKNIHKKKHIFECPICKTKNTIEQPYQKLFSVENTCCICLDNKVDIFLPNCGHVCICELCMLKIDTNKDIDEDNFKIYTQEELPNNVIEQAKKKFFNKEGKIYTTEYGGMGCLWYLRCDFKNGDILGAFLHSDMMGQYGISHVPLIEKFTENYTLIIH